MNEIWEERRVSNIGEVCKKIAELPRPVGVIIFGADCKIKRRVLNDAIARLVDFTFHMDVTDMPSVTQILQQDGAAGFYLDGQDSVDHEIRHGLVQDLRNAGAKSVAAIYVKPELINIRPTMSLPGSGKQNWERMQIEESNPSSDGLDYFVEVREGD